MIVKPGTIPVSKPPRRIPLSLYEKVKIKLSEMEKRGIIRRREEPSAWSHQLVIVEKSNGSLRLCLDPLELNKNLKGERFLIPTLEDFSQIMGGMKYFSVFDLREGFWQVRLCPSSKELTVFSTPFGTYEYNVLPFGVKTAAEKFQNLNFKYFGNLPGVFVYIDDIIVGGKSLKEHDENVQRVIDRARSINVKFNKDKLQYRMDRVRYLGHIFTGDSIAPDPDRVEAILQFKDPTNKKDLEKIMGTLNYLRSFIPNFSELNAPLRN